MPGWGLGREGVVAHVLVRGADVGVHRDLSPHRRVRDGPPGRAHIRGGGERRPRRRAIAVLIALLVGSVIFRVLRATARTTVQIETCGAPGGVAVVIAPPRRLERLLSPRADAPATCS